MSQPSNRPNEKSPRISLGSEKVVGAERQLMSNVSLVDARGNRSAPITPAPWSEADRLTRRLAASGLARLQEQLWGLRRSGSCAWRSAGAVPIREDEGSRIWVICLVGVSSPS